MSEGVETRTMLEERESKQMGRGEEGGDGIRTVGIQHVDAEQARLTLRFEAEALGLPVGG